MAVPKSAAMAKAIIGRRRTGGGNQSQSSLRTLTLPEGQDVASEYEDGDNGGGQLEVQLPFRRGMKLYWTVRPWAAYPTALALSLSGAHCTRLMSLRRMMVLRSFLCSFLWMVAIGGLFFRCGPSAIRWHIAQVVVDSVYRTPGGPLAHVR